MDWVPSSCAGTSPRAYVEMEPATSGVDQS